jgi:hypothetical protein
VITNEFGALISAHYASDHFARSAGVLSQAWGGLSAPGWLKIMEAGAVFTSYESVDGVTWVGPVVTASIPGMVGKTKYIGVMGDYGFGFWMTDHTYIDNFSIAPGSGSALTGACLVTPTVTPTP